MLNKLQELKKRRKSEASGFTIIEVMIVLAIAGLILLIVLLAIPALQRNSRNTAIKNDVSAVSGAISEYKSNNDGTAPTGVAISGGEMQVTGGGTTAVGKVQAGTKVTTGTAPGEDPGTIQVIFGVKCENPTSFETNTSVRSAAILYNIETSSTVAPRCLDA